MPIYYKKSLQLIIRKATNSFNAGKLSYKGKTIQLSHKLQIN